LQVSRQERSTTPCEQKNKREKKEGGSYLGPDKVNQWNKILEQEEFLARLDLEKDYPLGKTVDTLGDTLMQLQPKHNHKQI